MDSSFFSLWSDGSSAISWFFVLVIEVRVCLCVFVRDGGVYMRVLLRMMGIRRSCSSVVGFLLRIFVF